MLYLRNENKTQRRSHVMPFGPSKRPDGKTEFRLWAPDVELVKLVLHTDSLETIVDMKKGAGGWHNLETLTFPGVEYQFMIDDARFPDPASRNQKNGVHGSSVITDPTTFNWCDTNWMGRPWEETVLYEIHVGTYTPEGTFAGVEAKLDYLYDLGITAIELMPVSHFPGHQGWGYDGVLPYAPHAAYGTPDDLKRLIQAAHLKNIQVFLDVVYNHFGPEGNYLNLYAKSFFTEKYHTPWGAALNFEGSKEVREYFIHNALYWLEEFNLDGLRLDAVHAIKDESKHHFLIELAERVHLGPGQERVRHLVLENENNQAKFLERSLFGTKFYSAQWNDDIHHAYHVLATGECSGYYSDYANNKTEDTATMLCRALTQGFIYQGQISNKENEKKKGEPSAHLPPDAFISFLQNHDQIGNRALGERLAQLASDQIIRSLAAVFLLAPNIPLLFMGEEWGCSSPFLYFCDMGPELAPLITKGRRDEFAGFYETSSDPLTEIPDPCDAKTFEASKIDWSELDAENHRSWLTHYSQLLRLRQERIVPLIKQIVAARVKQTEGLLIAEWISDAYFKLILVANLSETEAQLDEQFAVGAAIEVLYGDEKLLDEEIANRKVPPFSVLWFISRGK